MKRAILMVFLLTSCGDTVDPILQEPLDSIETALGITVDYPVVVGRAGGVGNGYCQYLPSRKVWIDVTALVKEDRSILLTLLHEVGHCSFELDHRDREFLPDGCPAYIMQQGGKRLDCEKHFNYYIDQLKVEGWKNF